MAKGRKFIICLKDNAHYRIVEESAISKIRNILSDQFIELEGFYSHRNSPVPLRKLEFLDEENEKIIVLLTNHLDFGATTIAAIYKARGRSRSFLRRSNRTSRSRPL